MSSALSTFRRFGSLDSASPKTAPSFVVLGFFGFATACSRRARCKATRSARSGSRHRCSFFRSGFIDLTISGYVMLVMQHQVSRLEPYSAPVFRHSLWRLVLEHGSAALNGSHDLVIDISVHAAGLVPIRVAALCWSGAQNIEKPWIHHEQRSQHDLARREVEIHIRNERAELEDLSSPRVRIIYSRFLFR